MTAVTTAELEPTSMRKITDWLRANGPRLALEVVVNIALPTAIYSYTHTSWGDAMGLLASSAPPLLWGIGTFAKERRVDALSVLALVGIALSLLAFVGGGSVRLLELKEKLVTLLFAFVFLGSAAIGKPLIYPLARATMARKSREEGERFVARQHLASVRHTVMMMTLVWGFGLLADGLLSILLVFTLSIPAYLIAGPILGYGAIGGLTLWTILYRRQRQRKVARDLP
ncbi:MAG TPA: VC0807 family protein [Sphingomonas sp.]|uniref:VC0807 family protein n=1 Tax=Sphingomonas sp. TaxID=28214 RepID=UPI002C4CF427|nr:VC0807 family protein [Sphingomonas sp.]HMI19706.1 VC0807 family protein [Sphingomonas sp.]